MGGEGSTDMKGHVMAHIPRPIIDQTIELALTIIEQYQLIRTLDTIVSEVQSINVHITEDQIREYLDGHYNPSIYGG